MASHGKTCHVMSFLHNNITKAHHEKDKPSTLAVYDQYHGYHAIDILRILFYLRAPS